MTHKIFAKIANNTRSNFSTLDVLTSTPRAVKILHIVLFINFIEKLKNKFNIEIEYVDERMTTLMAQQVLIEGSVRRENRKKYIDKIAATYILQSYLDRINL